MANLSQRGELYFIEVTGVSAKPLGDVTFSENDLPIVIGVEAYRSIGLGRRVIAALIERVDPVLSSVTGSDIYMISNPPLLKFFYFTSFGFLSQ